MQRWHSTQAYAIKDHLYRRQPARVPGEYKTLAFYKFYPIDIDRLPAWREQLLIDLAAMNIVGRVYIATEGINAQLSCPTGQVEALRTLCESKIKPLLGGSLMDLNFATEHGKPAFRALHVRIRKQLVADGLDPTSYNLQNQPSHLTPVEWHHRLSSYRAEHGKDPVLIDMRNQYESEIGYFEGSVRPKVDTFRGSIDAMNDICADLPRDQEVFMYCTGGIRCSKAGAILQSSGFEKVHLVEGGVTAYGRWLRDQGDAVRSLYRGKNFTFDGRLGESITDEVFGRCQICGQPTNRYQNCSHAQCNILTLCCHSCSKRFMDTCGRITCYDTVHDFVKRTGRHFVEPKGAVVLDGVRAHVKQNESTSKATDRVVIGRAGEACTFDHRARMRAADVLGEPGEVLNTWAKAGRSPPPPHDTPDSPLVDVS